MSQRHRGKQPSADQPKDRAAAGKRARAADTAAKIEEKLRYLSKLEGLLTDQTDGFRASFAILAEKSGLIRDTR